MRKNLFRGIFSFIIIVLPAMALSQNYTIMVNITGLHSNKGKVILYLYNSADGYPQNHSKAFQTTSNKIINNKCIITLKNVPKGTYAIGYFHDENDNGKLDTNFLGIPSEGVGASNNAKGFMGPPKFKDAMFMVESDISISLIISY